MMYEITDELLRITKDERNDWPITVLGPDKGIIAFIADMGVPTHFIECTINNKTYYGQRILILKEKTND